MVAMRGHVRERGKGRWQVVVEAGTDPVTGKRRQVYRAVRGTRRQADEVLARLLVEVGHGSHLGSDSTIAELLEAYLVQAELSPTTRSDYERVRDQMLPDWLAKAPVWKVRPQDLDRAYRELAAAGWTANRVQRCHTVLSSSFTLAVRWGWITTSPARSARPPAPTRREVDPPDVDVTRRLLAAAGDDFGAWLRVAATTGARRGEVCGLQWRDVDTERSRLTIRRAVVYTPATGIVVKSPKTKKSRVVGLDGGTVESLRGHWAKTHGNALAVGLALPQDAFVFSMAPDGSRPWRPDYCTDRFSALRKTVPGAAAVRLHDLRHAVATDMLADGVDVRTVAGRLGHARASTTLEIYAAFVPAADQLAADRRGSRLDG
jgi:integrase